MRLPPITMAAQSELISERSATFHTGDLFYKPKSRIIRDLGVLALAVLGEQRQQTEPLQVLDAMSGSGVRSLRYARECNHTCVVHSNERMFGQHPLHANLQPIVDEKLCTVTEEDAVDLYLRARIDGNRFDLVDCDAFGTGQPHLSEAWWAVNAGGLLYLCATDSCTTAGHNPHKATSGYAAAAHHFPACNEQGLRLVLGAAWREAAARNLHASPVFSYFHQPSSSFRVMLRLDKPKRPPAQAYENLMHVARCKETGELWTVRSDDLGSLASRSEPCEVMGPMWVGPMHDGKFLAGMTEHAKERGWHDVVTLLDTMADEAEAEASGALLFYHLGEVQRQLVKSGLELPPLPSMIEALREAGFGASHVHSERKALKTSATLEEVVSVVRGMS